MFPGCANSKVSSFLLQVSCPSVVQPGASPQQFGIPDASRVCATNQRPADWFARWSFPGVTAGLAGSSLCFSCLAVATRAV